MRLGDEVKAAIRPHKTATTNGTWDGQAAVANCPATEAALRAIHAWVDDKGDPASKSSYKMPHHASPGAAANLTACVAAIAVLNGGRGGTSIPSSDFEGVYAHLAKHMTDGGENPPPLKGAGPMDYKVARFQGLKQLNEQGEFVATIARFNHVDLDGDVTVPGAFPEGKQVQIAQWGHNWGDLPYGIATLRSSGDEQQAHGQFNLNTSHGRDAYETVKMGQNIQEWSYGFQILQADYGTFEGQDVRFLKALDVAEISPVMRGAAGPGMTRVEEIKGFGLTMDEQAAVALEAIASFVARCKSLADMRRQKAGRVISAANAERIQRVHAGITAAVPDLEELLALVGEAAAEEDSGDVGGKATQFPDLLARYALVKAEADRVLAHS